jgi:hypothetical protein
MAIRTLINSRMNPVFGFAVWFLRTPFGLPFRARSTPLCGKGCACDSTTGCTAP